MTTANEYTLVEKPILDALKSYGYSFVHHTAHPSLRAGENEVLFKPHAGLVGTWTRLDADDCYLGVWLAVPAAVTHDCLDAFDHPHVDARPGASTNFDLLFRVTERPVAVVIEEAVTVVQQQLGRLGLRA